MGLFKSQEEKAREKDEKVQALLDKYGVGDLSDPEDRELVLHIIQGLAGTMGMEIGSAMAPNQNTFMRLQNVLQRTIMDQNFVIIRQLDRIAKALEK